MRFRPPRLPGLPGPVAWVLARAFAPPGWPASGPVDGRAALEGAVRLGMAERIGARVAAEQLTRETGTEAAVAFVARSEQARRRGEALAEAARAAGEVAERRGLPLAALKFLGLLLRGRVSAASRRASDVDLLVPEGRQGVAAAVLEELGFSRCRADDPGKAELAPLVRADGLVVEVHWTVRGVRLPGEPGFARFDGLAQAGLLDPPSDRLPGLHVPSLPLLTAHALAHGLAHHAFPSPEGGYPMLRMVADLVDLGAARGPTAGRHPTGDIVTGLVGSDLAPDEVEGALRLAARLVEGDLPPCDGPGSDAPESVLLRHALAGALDEGYVRSMRVDAVLGGLVESGRASALARGAAQGLWPDSARGGPRRRLPWAAARRGATLLRRWVPLLWRRVRGRLDLGG